METEKTTKAAQTGKQAPEEARCLTLHQKLVEMRKACPEIVQKQYRDTVSYKYAKIYDVWEKITPVMNQLGVDFDILDEKATRHDENGDPIFWITMNTKTRTGERLMFIYEADLTIRWMNLDDDEDVLIATVHAVAWNDDPAKAKGAAHTYALKYYLFEKFSIDQGEDDPDNSDMSAERKNSGGYNNSKKQQNDKKPEPVKLSTAQLDRLYKKAEACGMSKELTNSQVLKIYKKNDPADLTRQEYDEICQKLDSTIAKRNQQGGQENA